MPFIDICIYIRNKHLIKSLMKLFTKCCNELSGKKRHLRRNEDKFA